MNDTINKSRISPYILPGLPGESQHKISMYLIVKIVSSHFNISLDQMMARSRSRKFLEPRQTAMFLCREYTGGKLAAIGSFFDRDHATIIHACKRISALCKTEKKIRKTMRTLRLKLGVDVKYLRFYDLSVAKKGDVLKLCYGFENPKKILYRHIEASSTAIFGEVYNNGRWSGRQRPLIVIPNGDIVSATDDTQRIYHDEYENDL